MVSAVLASIDSARGSTGMGAEILKDVRDLSITSRKTYIERVVLWLPLAELETVQLGRGAVERERAKR